MPEALPEGCDSLARRGTDGADDVERRAASAAIVPPRRAGGEPPFAAPWEAQAFGLVVHLHGRGLFGWEAWTAALAEALDGQDADAHGADYYRCWLAALERLLVARGVARAGELDALAAAWQRAARATPHGEPIALGNDPERHLPS